MCGVHQLNRQYVITYLYITHIRLTLPSPQMRCTRAAAIGLLLCGLAAAQSPHDLNGNLYDNVAVESGSQAAAADAPYWWMNKGSPFKRSYDSQQSSSNNYNSNPFLNGASNFVADSLQAAASPVAAYAAPGYLPPTENVVTISCAERGQVCVTKYLCRNGFVDREVTDGSKQVCFSSSFSSSSLLRKYT